MIKIELTATEAGAAAKALAKAATKAEAKGDTKKAATLRRVSEVIASAFVRLAVGAHESEPLTAGKGGSRASEAHLAIERCGDLRLTSAEAANLKSLVMQEWLSRNKTTPARSAEMFLGASGRELGRMLPGYAAACKLIGERMTELSAAGQPVILGIWFGQALIASASGIPMQALGA